MSMKLNILLIIGFRLLDALRLLMVPRGGIEPPTQGFSVFIEIDQGDEF